VTDPDRRVALPVGTIAVGRPPGELKAIADLVHDHGAVLVVVGHPISLDGGRGPAAVKAEEMADALRASLPVPVVLHDERLSSVEANRSLGEAGLDAKQRRTRVDAVAAQVILASWLDAQSPPVD
jgi:putative Holliday junction resolvase